MTGVFTIEMLDRSVQQKSWTIVLVAQNEFWTNLFPNEAWCTNNFSFLKHNKPDVDETKKTDEVTALSWEIYWLWWGKSVSLSVNLIFSAVLAYMSNIYPAGFTERWETKINTLFVTPEVIKDEKTKDKGCFWNWIKGL